MVDLHTHILPGIDDGAEDVNESIKLLEQCKAQRVCDIALTSHFDCEQDDLVRFLERRKKAYKELQRGLGSQFHEFEFKLGAEVLFSLQLLKMDMRRLCMEGTDILLLELPVGYRPQFLREVLYKLQSEEIIPLIAHVERYTYICDEPELLAEWLDAGAYMQVNASSVLKKDHSGKMAMKLIKWGLVQVISSDVHSLDRRPQLLKSAYKEIEKQIGISEARKLKRNALCLFEGAELDEIVYQKPKKILGRWI